MIIKCTNIFRWFIQVYLESLGSLALRIACNCTCNCISSRFFFPRTCPPRRFLQNFNARLSLDIRNNSRARFSYGANPHTSRIISRTNLACFVADCKYIY